jgi:copper chaperone CopZ
VRRIAGVAVAAGLLWGGQAFAESVKVEVNGMVCGFCAQGITKKLMASGAIAKVDVDLDAKVVSIEVAKDKTIDDKTLTSIIVDSGYQVVKITRAQP